jgi:hypothetical protein
MPSAYFEYGSQGDSQSPEWQMHRVLNKYTIQGLIPKYSKLN